MIEFSNSPLWLFLIIPAVVVSALWMYRKTKFPTRTRYLLSALRVLVLLALGILLLRPVFTSYNRELIKPVLAILVDNSKSITANEDSLEIKSAIPTQIAELEKSLADKYQVDVYLFDETARVSETPNFDGSYTNLSASLKTLEDNYDPKDLREVVIFSDGIINQGSDPNYIPPSYFKTHVVMLGNPEKEEDLSIASLEYNPSVYRGNTLALTVNWQNTGQSKKARLRVKKGKEQVYEAEINTAAEFGNHTLYIKPANTGNHLYEVVLESESMDAHPENNRKFFSVKVMESQFKIALLYDRPNPDLGAFQQALSEFEDFSLYPVKLGQGKPSQLDKVDASLVFLSNIAFREQLEQFKKQYASKNNWFFIRNGQHAELLSEMGFIPPLKLESGVRQENLVLPLPNPNYTGMQLNENWEKVELLAPMRAQLGTPQFSPAYQPVFFQQIGNLKSQLPLLASYNLPEKKGLVSIGWDWWKLRMSFYQEFEDHKGFDQWVSEALRFLASRDDKEQLKVIVPDNFLADSKQQVSALLFNTAGDAVFNADISFRVVKEQLEYNYKFVPSGKSYLLNLSQLEPGTYNFTASAEVEGKQVSKSGNFAVLPGNLETQNKVADWDLLRGFAAKNGGMAVQLNATDSLMNELAKNPEPGRLQSEKQRAEIISWKWICFFIGSLLAVEWYIRKQNGIQ